MHVSDTDRVVVQRPEEWVARIILNRPEHLNALSQELVDDFTRILNELAADDSVRVVVLTGSGDRAFSAGLDLKQANTLSTEELQHAQQLFARMWDTLGSFPKTLIAAVNGYAAGAAFQIVLNCDFIIVSESARLGMAEVNAGLACINGTWLLESIVGRIRTADVVLNGHWVTAQEALDWGVANAVASDAEVDETALGYARSVASKAPNALDATREVLRTIRDGGGMSAQASRVLGADIWNRPEQDQDRTSGIAAFATRGA